MARKTTKQILTEALIITVIMTVINLFFDWRRNEMDSVIEYSATAVIFFVIYYLVVLLLSRYEEKKEKEKK